MKSNITKILLVAALGAFVTTGLGATTAQAKSHNDNRPHYSQDYRDFDHHQNDDHKKDLKKPKKEKKEKRKSHKKSSQERRSIEHMRSEMSSN